jgi:hypothetical protein
MPVTLSNLKDRIRTAIANIDSLDSIMFGTKSNIALVCAGQLMEHILNFGTDEKPF